MAAAGATGELRAALPSRPRPGTAWRWRGHLGDLFVPVLNEVEYAARVDAHGKRDLLVQRAIRGVGHCDFTPEEFTTAFLDLVAWVESGIKPAGDDFLDPAAVADPSFGCAFTIDPRGDHLFATPCP